MAKTRLKLEFDGFVDIMEKLASLEANMKEPVNEALKASAEIVTEQLREEMKPHNFTGQTIRSLKKPKVIWHGNFAEVEYGFSISNGGIASVFLEYGRLKEKPKKPVVTTAVRKTKKKVKATQEKILLDALREAGGDGS